MLFPDRELMHVASRPTKGDLNRLMKFVESRVWGYRNQTLDIWLLSIGEAHENKVIASLAVSFCFLGRLCVLDLARRLLGT